jgi:hypothetical protein
MLTLITLSCCSQTKIAGNAFPYNRDNTKLNYILIGKENILWDTGADITLFFHDFAAHKQFVFPVIVTDYGKKRSVAPVYFSRDINLEPLSINHVFYLLKKQDAISPAMKQLEIGGILGMNVISRAHWLIDFTTHSVRILSDTAEFTNSNDPKLILSYYKRKQPKTRLSVQGIDTKNIIIDSGSTADMILFASDIEKINKHILPVDTVDYRSSGLYADSIREKQYIYHNISINGYTMDTLHIVQGNSRRLIGMGFFRKFDKVYLNTQEKTFRFY